MRFSYTQVTFLAIAEPSSSVVRLRPADWAVMALYMLVILAIGWHYASRSKTTDDYHLGGRTMRPWAVGVSLFSAIFSTITYLAIPGEIIRYGPMALAAILALPLVAGVVGWVLIPWIMRFHVTSAYEILETRLGLSVRLLGSGFFLLMRMLWMGMIIYVTIAKVFIPLTGLPASTIPWFCALMGLVTIAYTSVGGFRGVVVTNVVQTIIMGGGALLTIAIITWHVGSWWPRQWADHWQEPVLVYDPEARITLLSVVLATFMWHVCTAGSDQMAIQRYLSLPDARAVRRMFIISLAVNAAVTFFLAALGLSLLAYFTRHSEQMAPGQSILANADELFARFIMVGLPTGVCGLVIAGMLAEAMSSLSAGVSSCCSVVMVDFLERLGRTPETALTQAQQVRRAKRVSWAIGLVTILLTMLIGSIKGNLFELAYKVTNLFTAPLFGLFFMAMFVRWATTVGTIIGTAAGMGVTIAIYYWEDMTGEKGISFMWAMPLGFAAQVAVGSAVSLVPIGPESKPLIPREQKRAIEAQQ